MTVKRESEVTQSCPTPSDPMDCSPPGSCVHGIFQARVLEWGAIAFSASPIYIYVCISSIQSLSHVWLCDPMNHSMPGLPVHHQLPESTLTHVHWVSPSHPLSSPYPALNLFQHQGLFKWVSSLHQVAKVYSYIQIFLDLWWSYILINPSQIGNILSKECI